MKKEKEKLREELDQLGLEWYHCPPEDDAVRKKLEWKIFEDVYLLFQPPDYHPDHQKITEAISEMYLKDMRRFDAEKNASLSAFFGGRLRLRGFDIDREDKGLKREEVEDPDGGLKHEKGEDPDGGLKHEKGKIPDTGKKKSKWVNPTVQTDSDDGWPTISVPDPTGILIDLDDIACKLVAAMLDLSNRLEGRKNNPIRRNYYRLFFTDSVTAGIDSDETATAFRNWERDLFQVMKTQFLDYFMVRECRTVDAIKNTRLKPYGQMVPGRSMDGEPKQPLPLDVYVAYLTKNEEYKANEQAVSMQRTDYYEFLRSCLT